MHHIRKDSLLFSPCSGALEKLESSPPRSGNLGKWNLHDVRLVFGSGGIFKPKTLCMATRRAPKRTRADLGSEPVLESEDSEWGANDAPGMGPSSYSISRSARPQRSGSNSAPAPSASQGAPEGLQEKRRYTPGKSLGHPAPHPCKQPYST